MSHGHAYGWSWRKQQDTGDGTESFTHKHDRGDEPHEHVLRDSSTEVKRTLWTDQEEPR